MLNKILLLEDDRLFAQTLQDLLEEEGFEVTLCHNGEEAVERTFEGKFDLYLLDINVPLIDGVTLLGDLRGANDTTPAIFLTSHQDKSVLAKAFENGADDYMKKPFDEDELLIRMQAMLRRNRGESCLEIGPLRLDAVHSSVYLNGERLELSHKEYTLMALFLRNAGEIVTHERIFDALWSASQSVSDGAVRVYINRLKSEIGPERIENIRGVGYRFVP